MCRIGGRLRSRVARHDGVVVEIPPFLYLAANLIEGTLLGG